MSNISDNKKKRKNIALFLAMLENEFSEAVLEGAVKGAEEIDANLLVFPIGLIDGAYSDKLSNTYRYQYNTLSSFLRSKSIDGAIIEYGTIVSTIEESKKEKFLNELGDMPVVLLVEEAKNHSSILVNNKSGLEQVMDHLINDHKYTKIGFISGPQNNQDAIERLEVYTRKMKDAGLYLGEDWVRYGNFSIYSEEVVTSLVESHPDIEAIVFANDHMAMGAYPVLEKLGRKPGKDIFVTGFDNIPSSVLMDPPLTTVMADTKELSYRAVLELDKNEPLPDRIFVDTYMVNRESCGCSHEVVKKLDDPSSLFVADSDRLKDTTREKIKESEKRKQFQIELGNIVREMVFYQDSELEWYSFVFDILKKLEFGSGYLMLYEDCIYHRDHTQWTQPEYGSLVGYYKNEEKHLYDKGDYVCKIDNFFNESILEQDNRYDLLVVPLFFRENQYGLVMIDSDYRFFQFVTHIASQIGSTLEIMNIVSKQDKIKKELTAISDSRVRFLASMANMALEPIHDILGINEVLSEKNDSDSEYNKYSKEINRSATELINIVNSLLDYSRLESGKLTIVPIKYNLNELLDDISDIVKSKADSRNLELRLSVDGELPCGLIGDYSRIKQIIGHLLNMSIIHTFDGYVELNITGTVNNDLAYIDFEIVDSGMGMREEDIAFLMEGKKDSSLVRGDTDEVERLGFSIVKGILELMNSSLYVDSEINKGASFRFRLCQKITDATPVNADISKKFIISQKNDKRVFSAPEVNVLVIDDDELNRTVIKALLNKYDINVIEADSGRYAIELMGKYSFDLVIMDHMMNDLDGVETLAIMKKTEAFKENPIPVIVLTSNLHLDAESSYLKIGFDGNISKPIPPAELNRMLIDFLPLDKLIFENPDIKPLNNRRSVFGQLKKISDEEKKELLLIVDENPVTLQVAQKIFADIYETVCFSSGLKSLEYIRMGNIIPDLILLDANIKDISAFKLLAQFKGNIETVDVPVVFTSNDNSRDMEIKCFEEGAADYFLKPFIPEVLRKRIKKLLDLNRLQKHLEEEVAIQTKASEEGRRKVERLSLQSMSAMAAAIDAKDRYTNGHSERVAKYSNLIAIRAGKNKKETQEIYYIGLMHDVGKIGIPDDIINKKSKLDDAEFATIKTHPTIGADILKNIDEIPNIAIGARWHHERYDGRGYPDGLKGDEIPEIARIIGVADAYDAMTSNRSYRSVMSQEKVRSEIEKGKGSQFDPFFADIMLQIIDEDKDYELHE